MSLGDSRSSDNQAQPQSPATRCSPSATPEGGAPGCPPRSRLGGALQRTSLSPMPGRGSRLIRTLDELDEPWLAAALGTGPVDSFSAEPIGTGQMTENHRISLSYASP